MKGVKGLLLGLGILLAGMAWSHLRLAIPGRRFRQEFNRILTARDLAAHENRWSDWARLNWQMDEHFVRRDAWLAKMTPFYLRTMKWDDVKEKDE